MFPEPYIHLPLLFLFLILFFLYYRPNRCFRHAVLPLSSSRHTSLRLLGTSRATCLHVVISLVWFFSLSFCLPTQAYAIRLEEVAAGHAVPSTIPRPRETLPPAQHPPWYIPSPVQSVKNGDRNQSYVCWQLACFPAHEADWSASGQTTRSRIQVIILGWQKGVLLSYRCLYPKSTHLGVV